MSIVAGTRLGSYEIVRPIGEGGMGQVYLARDHKLDRDVAIKVLPAALASDPDRRARFEREAKTLGALNHPHIAAVYGLETAGDTNALVMELVGGATLAERIAASNGPMPLDEVLAIVRQIANALEAAHQAGIVHRDLKPANVKVRDDGTVKVLDFGLAKALAPEGASATADPMNSPTITNRGTEAGMILGTAAYMSPEQARGRFVDRRADVWALGVVLFEMLTGRRAFSKKDDSTQDVLAAVLRQDIDWTALPSDTPRSIRSLLRHCLEKDPAKRLDSMRAVQIEIDDAATAGPGGLDLTSRPDRRWLTAVSLTIGAVGIAAAAGVLLMRPPATPGDVMHLTISVPSDQQVSAGGSGVFTFSIDGRSLVYAGRDANGLKLFRRAMDGGDPKPIDGSDGAVNAYMSKDGRWIAFRKGEHLFKMPAEGGHAQDIALAQGAGGAAFLDDGSIVMAPAYNEGLFHLPPDGGNGERLTTPDHNAGELGHMWPDVLPGGQAVLFTSYRAPVDQSRIGVLDLKTRQVTWVVDGGFFARYAASGHLIYGKGDRLYAQPFDADRRVTTGLAVPVVDDVLTSPVAGTAAFALSSRGTLAYVASSVGRPTREVIWVDRTGNVQRAIDEMHVYEGLQLSPDGRQIALSIGASGHGQDVWTYDLGRGVLSRVTSGPSESSGPIWSANGSELFYSVADPVFRLTRISAGSSQGGRTLWSEPAIADQVSPSISSDGKWMAYEAIDAGTGANIYVRVLDGTAPARPFRATKATEERPAFSPDGKWLAYQSNESGRTEVYVEAFPGPGQRLQVSVDGGVEARWNRATGDVLFRRGNEIRAAAFHGGPPASIGEPRTLFTFAFPAPTYGGASWDVTADETRALTTRLPDANLPRRIEIVTNFTSQLATLAPKK